MANEFETLIWAIERGFASLNRGKTAIFGAKFCDALVNLSEIASENLTLFQRDFVKFTELKNNGFNVYNATLEDEFQNIILIAEKYKELNSFHIAKSFNLLAENGVFLIAAHNAIGAKSVIKNAAQIFGGGETFNKFHCGIFAARKNNLPCDQNKLNEFLKFGEIKKFGDYYAKSGVFSADKIDAGSQVLIEAIKSREIHGIVGDFGAGFGYLSGELLKTNVKIKEIFLIESDYSALNLAQMAIISNKAKFIWNDATKIIYKNHFDFIVMNPPFHSENIKDISLGISFINSAYNSLKINAVLYMVANEKLPYENTLKNIFKNYEIISREKRYKVIVARRTI
jgi:16S rRNA (guanine1207-N2)-methyltransferase